MEILRRFFELKILKSNGNEFQSLVETIMIYHYKAEFHQIKPNGRQGDGGNDGWIPNENIYMQIFGPDDLGRSADAASRKIRSDFMKILKSWDPNHQMKEYWFIVNDKYKGLPSIVHESIKNLENDFDVKTKVIGAKLLEFYFQKLDLQTRKDLVEFSSGDKCEVPEVVKSFMLEFINHLALYNFEIYEENLKAQAFSDTLWSGLSDIKNRLNYYKIPNEYKELKHCVYEFIQRYSLLKKHYESSEYCYYNLAGRNHEVKKLWKSKWIDDSEVFNRISNENEPIYVAWQSLMGILLNNASHSANKLLVAIRKYYNADFLKGFLASDECYDIPKAYKNIKKR